jgi:hypothetical protein
MSKLSYQGKFGAWLGDTSDTRKRFRDLAGDLYDVTLENLVHVSTVAELEAAVALQTAGQFIVLAPGSYVLTESLTILLASSGGGLIGVGSVSIEGDADADEAILIDPAVAAATFEYTLQNLHIKGGSNKIGLQVLNTATAKKVNVYTNQVDFEDNGTGKALTIINTDGANAIRVYMNGGNVDGIAHTPKDTGDRLILRGVNIEENLVAAVVDVVASYFFSNCKIPYQGMTGGHANNVISVVGCWTEQVAFVPVVVGAGDFPGAFSATIL